jgi:predicted Zn-dependent protease
MSRVRFSILLAVLALAARRSDAQTDSTISGPRAFALIQAGKFTEARTMLESLTTREPENPRAWMLLATSRYQLKDYTVSNAADHRPLKF